MKITKMLAGIAMALVVAAGCDSAPTTSPAEARTNLLSDPLTVELVGQSPILPNKNCPFTGYASGGTGNYTYYWSATYPGTGTAVGNEWVGRGSGNFVLTVTVTDGVDADSDAMTVTVASNSPSCPD